MLINKLGSEFQINSYTADYQRLSSVNENPDLAITNVSAPASGNLGDYLDVSWTVENQGGEIDPYDYGWYDEVAFSWDGYHYSEIEALGTFYQSRYDMTGDEYTRSERIDFSWVHDINYDGTTNNGYLIFIADSWNSIDEIDNDGYDGNNYYRVPFSINPPNLVITDADAPESANKGDSIDVSWTVENDSDSLPWIDFWYDSVYFSSDDNLDEYSDYELYNGKSYASYAFRDYGWSSDTTDKSLYIPEDLPSESGYLIFVVDSFQIPNQMETDEDDNTYAIPFTIEGGGCPGKDIVGTNGKDKLTGGPCDDTLRGLGERDLLDGGAGADSMEGGDGKDTYIVDNPGDVVVETNPSDKDGKDVVESSVDFTLPDYVENLTLTGNAIKGTGNSLNNFIVGNNSDNHLQGKDGKDKLMGRGGADTLNGGAGDDEYTVDADDTLTDSAGFDTVRSEVDWTLADGFERLVLINKKNVTHLNGTGNSLDNIIIGNKVINTLVGGDGNDEIHGKKGNDTLIGGNDADTLTGGDGNDSFQFNDETDGIDRITDFNVADDTILVNGGNFGGGLVAGAAITPAQFNLGSSASTSAHRFIYNSSNGALWFDANGSNNGGAVQIAQLNAGLGLTNQDIYVI